MKRITDRLFTDEIRETLSQLRSEQKVAEFRAIAEPLRQTIETEYALERGKLNFTEAQRNAYTTLGGYPDLDGKYTIFGECIDGFDVIDRIAAMPADENDRPLRDIKIEVKIL